VVVWLSILLCGPRAALSRHNIVFPEWEFLCAGLPGVIKRIEYNGAYHRYTFRVYVDRFFNRREGYMGAKIRHIAIATQDPDTMAHFFKQALGLKQVGVANSDLATGYFLTDGYINLAILKFKSDYAAYTEGAPRYEGLHHFGFKVDDLEEARQKVEEAGATFQPLGGRATGQGVVDVEVKYYLPNEVRIDLSENGWLTLTM
jgi:catechol 2,3-dioxygenase-like lactoylglutathione lyase family enzyme